MTVRELVAAAVVVLVDDLVERAAVGPFAHGEHAVAQRQDALHVFDFLAERRDGFEFAVAIGVADQDERAAFLRGQDVAVGS